MVRPPTPAGSLALTSTSSPPSTGLSVGISATLDYNGTPIPINSGDIADIAKNGVVFNLTQPVDLGTLNDFMDWLKSEFGLPDIKDDVHRLINAIPDTPDFLTGIKDGLDAFLSANISITTLNVNTKLERYAFGVTMALDAHDSPPGLPLFGSLRLNTIGVLVSKNSQ